MSRLYYDKLVTLTKLEKHINKIARSKDEKTELWEIVDEIIHHKVLVSILDRLDNKHHEEFLVKLYSAPHKGKLWSYLKKKIKIDIKEFIISEIISLESEILRDLKGNKSKRKITKKEIDKK